MTTATIGDNTGGSANTYAGCAASFMGEGSPTTNNGTAAPFQLTTYAPGDRDFGLLSFSGVSSLPAGATITAASIFLYKTNDNQIQEGNGQTTSPTIQAKRLLRNWHETQSTWNIYATASNWTTGGAGSDGNDRDADVSGSYTIAVGSGQNAYHEIPLNATGIADVQGWLDGTFSNYGWRMGYADESAVGSHSSQYQNFSSDDDTNGQRPYLSVTYTEASGNVIGRGLLNSQRLAPRSLVAMSRLVQVRRPALVGLERKLAA